MNATEAKKAVSAIRKGFFKPGIQSFLNDDFENAEELLGSGLNKIDELLKILYAELKKADDKYWETLSDEDGDICCRYDVQIRSLEKMEEKSYSVFDDIDHIRQLIAEEAEELEVA
jgi:hypothetical protein